MKNAVSTFILLLILSLTIRSVAIEAKWAQGWTWVTRKDFGDRIGELAPSGATVLCNEVQYKYYFRPDIRMRSLDGITDGKITKSDVYGFIKRENIHFWIPTITYGKWIDSTLNKITRDTVVAGITFKKNDDFFELSYH